MRNKNLWRYLAISFLVTYLCWGSLAIFVKLGLFEFSDPIAAILHLLGGFGPTIATLFVLKGKLSIRSLIRFVFGCRKKTIRYLLLFCVFEIAVLGVSSMEVNSAMSLYLIPVVFVQAVLLYGGNEEWGWRGIMQPILEKETLFPIATLITGSVWAVWHIPLWFVDGASQQNIPFPLFAALGIVLSFWLAAIYKQTHCVFCCSIFHGLTNTLLSLFVIKINAILVIGCVVMLAVSIYLWYLSVSDDVKEHEILDLPDV